MILPIEESIVSCIEALPGQRISVYRCQHGDKSFEIRFETYNDGIGWFVQNAIRLSQTEMSALRGLLGLGLQNCSMQNCQKQRICQQRMQADCQKEESEPRIIRFPELSPTRSNSKLPNKAA